MSEKSFRIHSCSPPTAIRATQAVFRIHHDQEEESAMAMDLGMAVAMMAMLAMAMAMTGMHTVVLWGTCLKD